MVVLVDEECVPILDSGAMVVGKEKREKGGKEYKGKKEEEGEGQIEEGGWGWVVVMASFLCNMVIDGIGYSFGVMLQPINAEFKSGIAYVAFVGSILAGVILLTGPLAAIAINRFGTRLTCITGSLISSIAILASSYATNLETLVVTYGVLGGFGLGLMYVPSVVAVGQYFSKRLSLATGICVCGSGAGTFAFAPLAAVFLENWGWRGCNRLLSLACLACSLCGLLMTPGKINKAKKTEDKTIGQSSWLVIMSSIPFLLVMAGNLPTVMAIYTTYTYMPTMAEGAGVSASDASFLISVIGVTNTLGRILSGWLTDLPGASALVVTIVASALACIFPALMPITSSSYSGLLAVAAIFGLLLAAIPSVTSSLLVDLLGIKHLNNSFGVLTFVRGVAAFIGPPIAGFVIETTQSLAAPFTVSSFLLLSSAIIHGLVWLLVRRGKENRRLGYTEI